MVKLALSKLIPDLSKENQKRFIKKTKDIQKLRKTLDGDADL